MTEAAKRPPILEAAVAAYQARGHLRLDVPEWTDDDGLPGAIWYTPMTVGDRDWIWQRAGRSADSPARHAWTLIRKARDGDGNRLFTVEHKKLLMEAVDARVVEYLAVAMWCGADDAPDAEAEAGDDAEGAPDPEAAERALKN